MSFPRLSRRQSSVSLVAIVQGCIFLGFGLFSPDTDHTSINTQECRILGFTEHEVDESDESELSQGCFCPHMIDHPWEYVKNLRRLGDKPHMPRLSYVIEADIGESG